MTPDPVMNFTKYRIIDFIYFIYLSTDFTSSHVCVWPIHTIQVHVSRSATYLSLNRVLFLLAHVGSNVQAFMCRFL